MNRSDVEPGCGRLLPVLPTKERTVNELSWQWSQHTLHQYSECVSMDTFITNTVPCPPPWNPCLFWSIVNNTKLTRSDLDSVQETCFIPDHSDCDGVAIAVKPEIYAASCNVTCITLVTLFLVFLIFFIFAVALWKWWTKRNLSEVCNGVCVCFDKVFIRKNGLNRTESRSPTLATENGNTDKTRKDRLEEGHDNECISLDLKNVTADYFLKSLERGNGIMEDDGDYATLREDEGPERHSDSYPAPDVTMVTVLQDDNDEPPGSRLSYC